MNHLYKSEAFNHQFYTTNDNLSSEFMNKRELVQFNLGIRRQIVEKRRISNDYVKLFINNNFLSFTPFKAVVL